MTTSTFGPAGSASGFGLAIVALLTLLMLLPGARGADSTIVPTGVASGTGPDFPPCC